MTNADPTPLSADTSAHANSIDEERITKTLRERKKLATRRALREATIRLGSERGFSNVTVEDIAAAADVSERTFFNYFTSKEAAIVGEDQRWLNELTQSIKQLPAEMPAMEKARHIALSQAKWIENSVAELGDAHAIWLAHSKTSFEDPDVRSAYMKHMTAVERAVSSALAANAGADLSESPEPQLITATALIAVKVAHHFWRHHGAQGSLTELADSTLKNLVNLFCNQPKGRPNASPDSKASLDQTHTQETK